MVLIPENEPVNMNRPRHVCALLGLCLISFLDARADWSLLVVGNPSNYGTPFPLGYGPNGSLTTNSWITNTVDSSVSTNGTNWGCKGWVLNKTGGAVVTNGPGTQAVFQMTTNLTLTWNWTNYFLSIAGNPVNHGTPSPLSYGTYSNIVENTWITNAVATPADLVSNSVKSDCLGWTLAYANGTPITNDSSTQAVFQMRADRLALTWNWTNEYYLSVTTNSHGTATTTVNNWYTNGVQILVSATPDPGYVFLQWSGDVPVGSNTNNPLMVTMDQPRAIQAQFVSDTPVTRTWTGKGNWFTTTNWTPQGIPGTSDDVYINSGTNVLSDPVTVASLTISNATLIFSNWNTTLSAPNVTISSNGFMTLPAAFNNVQMSNRVSIVCSTLMVSAVGQINVDGKGYAGGTTNNSFGFGPGGGSPGGGLLASGGGGYGGNGGQGETGGAPGGPTNGSVSAPIGPGSGGGGSSKPYGGGISSGSPGGGAVRIVATGRVTVNGIISATGSNKTNYGASGSGGGIYITCNVFGGSSNGVISAKGGVGGGMGDGGGGRIAVIYNSSAQSIDPKPRIQFLLDGGSVNAAPGSLYFTDTVVLDGLWMPTTGVVFVPGSSWSQDSILLGRGQLRFMTPGFILTVTNNLSITGAVSRMDIPTGGELHCGGNLILTNGSSLNVYSAATNGSSPNYGALVSVAGDINIASNSWICPYSDNTNGGSVLFNMMNLRIDAFGGINADGKGYAGGTVGGSVGFGPGGGAGGGGLTSSGGGGYGGKGGDGQYSSAWGGPTNGLINVPGPGSGAGGSPKAPPTVGSPGGGLVRIVATGTVTLNGIISVNGSNKVNYAGSGSGGGISIICAKLAGSTNGVMRANGGGSGIGVGGGGRIAVITRRDLFTGEAPGAYVAYAGSTNGCITVNPGPGGTATSGTFYLQILPQMGTTLILK